MVTNVCFIQWLFLQGTLPEFDEFEIKDTGGADQSSCTLTNNKYFSSFGYVHESAGNEDFIPDLWIPVDQRDWGIRNPRNEVLVRDLESPLPAEKYVIADRDHFVSKGYLNSLHRRNILRKTKQTEFSVYHRNESKSLSKEEKSSSSVSPKSAGFDSSEKHLGNVDTGSNVQQLKAVLCFRNKATLSPEKKNCVVERNSSQSGGLDISDQSASFKKRYNIEAYVDYEIEPDAVTCENTCCARNGDGAKDAVGQGEENQKEYMNEIFVSTDKDFSPSGHLSVLAKSTSVNSSEKQVQDRDTGTHFQQSKITLYDKSEISSPEKKPCLRKGDSSSFETRHISHLIDGIEKECCGEGSIDIKNKSSSLSAEKEYSKLNKDGARRVVDQWERDKKRKSETSVSEDKNSAANIAKMGSLFSKEHSDTSVAARTAQLIKATLCNGNKVCSSGEKVNLHSSSTATQSIRDQINGAKGKDCSKKSSDYKNKSSSASLQKKNSCVSPKSTNLVFKKEHKNSREIGQKVQQLQTAFRTPEKKHSFAERDSPLSGLYQTEKVQRRHVREDTASSLTPDTNHSLQEEGSSVHSMKRAGDQIGGLHKRLCSEASIKNKVSSSSAVNKQQTDNTSGGKMLFVKETHVSDKEDSILNGHLSVPQNVDKKHLEVHKKGPKRNWEDSPVHLNQKQSSSKGKECPVSKKSREGKVSKGNQTLPSVIPVFECLKLGNGNQPVKPIKLHDSGQRETPYKRSPKRGKFNVMQENKITKYLTVSVERIKIESESKNNEQENECSSNSTPRKFLSSNHSGIISVSSDKEDNLTPRSPLKMIEFEKLQASADRTSSNTFTDCAIHDPRGENNSVLQMCRKYDGSDKESVQSAKISGARMEHILSKKKCTLHDPCVQTYTASEKVAECAKSHSGHNACDVFCTSFGCVEKCSNSVDTGESKSEEELRKVSLSEGSVSVKKSDISRRATSVKKALKKHSSSRSSRHRKEMHSHDSVLHKYFPIKEKKHSSSHREEEIRSDYQTAKNKKASSSHRHQKDSNSKYIKSSRSSPHIRKEDRNLKTNVLNTSLKVDVDHSDSMIHSSSSSHKCSPDTLERGQCDEHVSDDSKNSSKEREVSVVYISPLDVLHAQRDSLYKKFGEPWIRMGTSDGLSCAAQPPEVCLNRHGREENGGEPTDCFGDSAFCHIIEIGFIKSAFNFIHGHHHREEYPTTCVFQLVLLFIMNKLSADAGRLGIQNMAEILNQHPPCGFGMQQYYSTVFFSPVDSTEFKAQEGIFWHCVCALEEDIKVLISDRKIIEVNYKEQEDDDGEDEDDNSDGTQDETDGDHERNDSVDNDNDKSTLEGSGYCDFPENLVLSDDEEDDNAFAPWVYEWGIVVTDQKISDESRMERKFLVLHFIVKVLERDMVTALVRRVESLPEYMKSEEPPLIVTAMWGNSAFDVGTVNSKCKKLMKMCIDMFQVSSCSRYMDCITKMISLMAEAVHASEENGPLLQYPHIGEKCKMFAREFSDLVLANVELDRIPDLLNLVKLDWFVLCVLENLFMVHCGLHFDTSLAPMVDFVKSVYAYKKNRDTAEPKVSLRSCDTLTEELRNFEKQALKKDCRGETKLHIACRRNNVTTVKKILRLDNVKVNTKDNLGWTPLHEAAFHGSADCVQLLLDFRRTDGPFGVDIFAMSNEGVTALMDAVDQNHLKVVELLVKYGGKSLLMQRRRDGVGAMDLVRNEEVKRILENAPSKGRFNRIASFTRPMHHAVEVLVPLLIFYYLQTFSLHDIVGQLKDGDNVEMSRSELSAKLDANKLKLDLRKVKKDYEALQDLRKFIFCSHTSDYKLVRNLIWLL